MHPYILKLGPLTLSSYGLMLAISFMVGVHLAKKRGMNFGLSPEWVDSFSMGLILWGVIGSRAMFVFVEQGTQNWKQPWVFLRVWEGGLSFTGGFVLAILYALWKSKKEKLSFLKIADIFSPSLCLGQSIAKIGCFLAGCCHGKICNLPWAISFNHPETLAHPRNTPLHPSQLYESLMALCVFGILMFLWKRRKFEGQIFLSFLILFGTGRFFLEFTRGSEPMNFLGISSPQTIIGFMALGAMISWPILSKKNKLL